MIGVSLIPQAEWGQVLFGRVLVSAVDENGRHQTTELEFGDIWYFPKGQAHTIQGLEDENEYLLAFDDADFDRAGSACHLLSFDKIANSTQYNLQLG